MPCLDERVLQLAGEGREPITGEMETHLRRCVPCRQRMSQSRTADQTRADRVNAAGSALGVAEGAVVGRYRVVCRLAEGGMGVVYAAADPQLNRQVALKLLRSDDANRPEAHARLLREAQAMAKLSHPNVVPVFDAGS